MKTFNQYLEESLGRKIGAGAAALGIALGARQFGNSMLSAGSEPKQTQSMSSETPAPVTPIKPQSEPPKTQPVKTNNTDTFHAELQKKHGKEYETIMDAALNNGIARNDHENLSILFSIRKAENGKAGREFGVLHPKAVNTNLRTQAGWAAATIMNHRKRHDPKKDGDFIASLSRRYAPVGAENDPNNLNRHWLDNVSAHHQENMSALSK